ncbi:MAG: hypothetical protein FWC93_00845 [Defluviitaleaceae bacterium]|nr:hypothetical protein [Defluviitaleaceae bacterium]
MLFLAIGLFIAAVLILAVDIYIEGFGPLGVVGLIVAAASLFISIAWVDFGGFIVLGKIAVMVPGTLLFYRFLRARQLDGKLVLTETLAEDVVDVSGLEYFMGKEGITKTALRPHGRADFNGTTVEVHSDSGYIPTGKRVKVVDVLDKKVFVRQNEN